MGYTETKPCDCCNSSGCCWTLTALLGNPSISIGGGHPASVQVSFQTSSDCGGPGDTAQSVGLQSYIYVIEQTELTVNVNGMVEGEDPGYDRMTVSVNGSTVVHTESTLTGNLCATFPVSGQGSIILPPGHHQIAIFTTTGDERYSAGVGYSVSFGVNGLLGTCDNCPQIQPSPSLIASSVRIAGSDQNKNMLWKRHR
jgi:hypothetical protein